MVVIRAEREDDREAIWRINRLAFGRDEEADLVDAIRGSAGFIPELSRLAIVDGEPTGHVMLSRIEIQTGSASVPALALAPVAVVPTRQREGIGTKLIQEALRECRRLGHQIVVVIGHPDYYPRFGFRPARAAGINTTWPVPDPAFMVLELQSSALDGLHGMVRYPAVFGEDEEQ